MRQKFFDGKFWYSPVSYPWTYSLLEAFRNTAQKGSLAKFFGTARRKKNSPKNCDISLLSIKLFDTRNQWHPKRFPYEFFRHCGTQNFRRKFCETQKVSPTKFFGTVRQNNFDRKSWYQPPLLSLTYFGTRNFLEHRRVPRRNFSALWDKKFSTENRDTFLHKVQKSVVELMLVKTLWKLISKQLFCF